MSNKSLSERLKFWRVDRPDEWIMDEFIRDAEVLERQHNEMAKYRDDDDMTRALLRVKENMRTGFNAGLQDKEALTVNLRDKFAMAALQGLCASGYYDGQSWDKDLASDAYTAADAMLKERVK